MSSAVGQTNKLILEAQRFQLNVCEEAFRRSGGEEPTFMAAAVNPLMR
jgi:hypothetical protein